MLILTIVHLDITLDQSLFFIFLFYLILFILHMCLLLGLYCLFLASGG